MFSAVPARISIIAGQKATVDAMGDRWEVDIALTPAAVVGDIVLIHGGFSIAVVDKDLAERTWPLIAKVSERKEQEDKYLEENK